MLIFNHCPRAFNIAKAKNFYNTSLKALAEEARTRLPEISDGQILLIKLVDLDEPIQKEIEDAISPELVEFIVGRLPQVKKDIEVREAFVKNI